MSFFYFKIFDSPEFDIYKGKREIKMQKTTEGLGVMIIEGAHKLLGKGIFVSDIQQKSLAFKVRLINHEPRTSRSLLYYYFEPYEPFELIT